MPHVANVRDLHAQAERLRQGFLDHKNWAEASLDVRSKAGGLIPYQQGPAQFRLWDTVRRLRERRRPIRVIYLKSRQVWVSTGTAALYYQDLAFHSGRHAKIVAHEREAAGDIFDYYKTFQQSCRPYDGLIRPARLVNDANGLLKWDNGSWARIQTAANLRSGRSANVQLWHLSEFSLWPRAQILMRGILGSCAKTPDTSIIVESTANGVGDPFFKLCQDAMDPSSDSGWTFIFFAWWEHPEYVLPLPCSERKFQDSLDGEEREIRKRYNLSLEQIYWRRWMIATEFKGDIDGFKQEYPANPEEAFIYSGRPRFPHAELARMPVLANAPCGELHREQIGVERRVRFFADGAIEFDEFGDPVEDGEQSGEGAPRAPGFGSTGGTNKSGALTVYRMPERGRLYAIGADTAKGRDINDGEGSADPDFSVATVLDIDSAEQVAKFRARLEPAPFGEYLHALGEWYHWAFLVVEINGPGLGTVEELLRSRYPLSHLYHRTGQPKDPTHSRGSIHMAGYETTSITRPTLISNLHSAILARGLGHGHGVTLRDPHTVQECQTFIIKPNGDVEGAQGCHDDEVFALALAVVGLQSFPDQLRQAARGPVDLRVKRYGPRAESEKSRRDEFLARHFYRR